ncbi:uncharacterized protein LACBIDRAFT_316858 [Laccaria bicolor S238N-H82]|uniref:Predicted protein n=1 Tax=Laccaria bicolor (strain S238N-H82 / ATCC MYA-4686) TaxID=486041 RepID=B0E1R8_LACBS|nr:uncharacterized protein LACBIDRAFT_316858 [Laccaria bicolor S238N-H82]EDQ99244.1 predicted protein [Laccaria bicolor S238N-H82]|eukprot:XP_001890141.1 predicted protein [Laccaria bicolor S238N-H82]
MDDGGMAIAHSLEASAVFDRVVVPASVLPIRFECKNTLKCQRWQSQDVRLCYLQSKFPHPSSERVLLNFEANM